MRDLIDRQAAIDAINKALDRETLLNSFVRKVAIDAVKELPPAQPEREDAVPRTSIEYICRKNTVSTNPYEHKYHDKFIQFMDDPEISDFGRWQHSNGFNTALVAVKCDLDKLPSVTPKQPGWIPVTERLPEYFVPVLTWDGQNQCVEMRIPYVITKEGEIIKNDWWCCDYWEDKEESLYNPHDLRDGAALAWMPLPKPAKIEG